MTTRPGDNEADLDEPVEREGHETLLPSVTRSVLSTKSFVASEATVDSIASVIAGVAGDDSWDGKHRGAKGGDVIGGRYIVDGQLGRGGMGRVLRVRHQALGKAFALKLIKSRIATNPKMVVEYTVPPPG